MYVDHELVTYRDSYPGVAAWLEGADTGHWWAWVLDVPRDPRVTPPTREDMALGTMEILVRAVQGASPEGMSLFIASRFRDPNLANVLSARLELLCAANLAACRVPFAFGGKGEPDLTWNPGTDAPGWLEIHRGGFSVFDDLEQELDRDLGSKGAVLRIRLGEWPLEVRDRNLLRTRVSDATDAALATGQEQRVTMAELGPGATGIIEPGEAEFPIGRILVETPGFWPSDGYLASVSARLARKINVDKATQGRKGHWDPTGPRSSSTSPPPA